MDAKQRQDDNGSILCLVIPKNINLKKNSLLQRRGRKYEKQQQQSLCCAVKYKIDISFVISTNLQH